MLHNWRASASPLAMSAMVAHLLGMLQRCTHQPEIKTARSRVASPPALPNWSRKFHDPIPVQNSKPLVTLRDAATYITVTDDEYRSLWYRSAGGNDQSATTCLAAFGG
jgi:hypothetical protein